MLTEGKSGQKVVLKWLSITDEGNGSRPSSPFLSSSQMHSDSQFRSPGRWQDSWVHSTPGLICALFRKNSSATLSTFYMRNLNPPVPSLARGKGAEVYRDVNVLCPVLRPPQDVSAHERTWGTWDGRLDPWVVNSKRSFLRKTKIELESLKKYEKTQAPPFPSIGHRLQEARDRWGSSDS